MNGNQDYYEVLGIDAHAEGGQVKEAYRKLAFQYHPDRNPEDDRSVEKMKEINEAYAVLSDPAKRRNYDLMRTQYGSSSAYDQFRQTYSERDIFRDSDINQIFEEMARSFGFRGFDEIFRNVYGREGYQTFEFRRPGVFGKFIIFGSAAGRPRAQQVPGPGPSAGILGKVAGYLLKKAFSVDSESRDGKDLEDVISLEPAQALYGGKMKYVDRRRGKEILITVPAGIKEHQKIRLKGMGSPGKDSGRPGDLYLRVEIRKSLLGRIKEFLKP
jgi:DnaJ-class molecular chaperone